jgi:hypothetical protein
MDAAFQKVYTHGAVAGLLTSAMQSVQVAQHLCDNVEDEKELRKLYDEIVTLWALHKSKADIIMMKETT